MKIEPASVQKSLLEHEAHVLRTIGRNPALPQFLRYGRTELFSYILMQLLGDSLASKFAVCGFRFSLQTLLGCGEQMATAVAAVHSCTYVHRDIKPQNFLLGRGASSNSVFLVDFGLSRKFDEIQFSRGGGTLTGTPTFASLNAHLGLSPARRDDLESLAYVLLYFLKGRLPWYCPAAPCQNEKEVRGMKERFDPFQFCEGHPTEFAVLLQYSRSLRFDQSPDYSFVLSLFRGVAKRLELSLVIVPDWETESGRLDRRRSVCEWKKKSKKEKKSFSRRSFRLQANCLLKTAKNYGICGEIGGNSGFEGVSKTCLWIN